MKRETGLAETIDKADRMARYDRSAKKLLAFKAIDAWILKCCVKEFSSYDAKYISEHCLTGDPEISEHAVNPDQLNRSERISGDEELTMMNSESSSISEGTIFYDVRFNAVVPESGNPVTLIINLEIQLDDKPGYELVTRGMYYCARMISEQHGSVFTESHYEKIRKVYSIWICPSTPQSRKNSIFRYHMVEEPVIGKSYVGERSYDLEEVIVLNLGEAGSETDSDILKLLNTYFSNTVQTDEKKRVLDEEFNITMTKDMEEEVHHMCNWSSAIERAGIEKGRAEGIAEGEARGEARGEAIGEAKGKFETTARYYRNGIITAEYAASDLGMTVAEFLEKAGRTE